MASNAFDPANRDDAAPSAAGLASELASGLASELASGAGVHVPSTVERSAKILVVGGFGVGKTTLIGEVSEIRPLRTEEQMTQASVGVDDLRLLPDKTTTTVAMDFGRLVLRPRATDPIVLYVFGAPGQKRFWNLWKGLFDGAIGALVLIDTRRLNESFEVLDQLEEHRPYLPLTVAINHFPDTTPHPHDQLRTALDLEDHTPIIDCDATDPRSSLSALITLVSTSLTKATT